MQKGKVFGKRDSPYFHMVRNAPFRAAIPGGRALAALVLLLSVCLGRAEGRRRAGAFSKKLPVAQGPILLCGSNTRQLSRFKTDANGNMTAALIAPSMKQYSSALSSWFTGVDLWEFAKGKSWL
ncbi:hypothetical protein KUV24_01840 [Nitratireductor sp. DP7N14-4]|nr:hypothetical protein [Nitratireductor sp. DP7N14-4]